MKVLAVCGFGVGSSMILKMTIEKAFREFGVEAKVINSDISDVSGQKADAIFSSPDIIGDIERRLGSSGVKLYGIKKYSDVEEVKASVEKLLEAKDMK